MAFPILTGPRLILDRLDPAAIDDLHEYSVRPEFYRFLEFPPFTERAQTAAYFAKLQARSNGETGHYWLIRTRADGKTVGTLGLLEIDRRKGSAELGYGLAPSVWGRGLFAEALGLVLDWAFGAGGFHRLWVKTQADNLASIKALAAAGFRREGVLRDFYLSQTDGRRHDAALFALLGPDRMTDTPIPGLVTVRTSSSRLPQKCLLPFGEDCNVLQHILRRARAFGIEPIVCTSVDPGDDVIEALARAEGARCFRGSLVNKLKRWSDCAQAFGLECFHTVDADDPFFDGAEMRRSLALLREGGWDMVAPTESSSAGGASVGYSLTAAVVARAVAGLDAETDTEMMWYHVAKVPGLKKTVLPEIDPAPVKARLTLDYAEDYWLLDSIRRMVGTLAPRPAVDELLRRNPDLYKINWFRNEEWAAGQAAKRV